MRDEDAAEVREVILVVDDDATSRKLVETVLKPHSYYLLFAKNGPEAIDIATQEQPDLILMDMKLPVISGCDAVQALKSQPATANIPIVALTAHGLGEAQRDAMEAGCTGYIVKPIDTRAFPGQLQEYIKRNVLD
jgi:CheY-like chemotaxis protein